VADPCIGARPTVDFKYGASGRARRPAESSAKWPRVVGDGTRDGGSGVYLTISISYPAALGARTERATSMPAAHVCATFPSSSTCTTAWGRPPTRPSTGIAGGAARGATQRRSPRARRSTPPGRTCCGSSGATTDPDTDGCVPIGATELRRRRDRRQGAAVCVRGPLPTALPPRRAVVTASAPLLGGTPGPPDRCPRRVRGQPW